MKVLRDLERLKPSSMVVLGETIDRETIDTTYEARAAIHEQHVAALAETVARYGKFRFDDIMKRIEWAFSPFDKPRAKTSAREVFMWFNLFTPFENVVGISHWVDVNRLNELTNFNDDPVLLREISMFVLQRPTLSAYELLSGDAKTAYLDWAVFMALTSDQAEVETYGTRSFRE